MNKKVLILHGWGGSDFPHWQSWLAGEIAKDYGTVSFLRFKDVDNVSLKEWREELKEHLKSFEPDIVICHSLANTLWFHMCNDKELRGIEKLYLVAPPSMECDIEELKTFYPITIPTDLYAKKAILVTSTNDPYMTQDEAKTLQNELGVEMKVLQNAGHINADSGYGKWDWILKDLPK